MLQQRGGDDAEDDQVEGDEDSEGQLELRAQVRDILPGRRAGSAVVGSGVDPGSRVDDEHGEDDANGYGRNDDWASHRREGYHCLFADGGPFRRCASDSRTLVMVAMGTGYCTVTAARRLQHRHAHRPTRPVAVDNAAVQGAPFMNTAHELDTQRPSRPG